MIDVEAIKEAVSLQRCKTCNETKPLDEFYDNPSLRNGKFKECKKCCYLRQLAWQKANPERYKAKMLKSGKTRLVRQLGRRREILEFQDWRCAICRTPLEDGHTDHDHSCKTHETRGYVVALRERCWCVRGILCNPCNAGVMRAIDSGFALPGPEVQHYLDNPPAQVYFALLELWEQSA